MKGTWIAPTPSHSPRQPALTHPAHTQMVNKVVMSVYGFKFELSLLLAQLIVGTAAMQLLSAAGALKLPPITVSLPPLPSSPCPILLHRSILPRSFSTSSPFPSPFPFFARSLPFPPTALAPASLRPTRDLLLHIRHHRARLPPLPLAPDLGGHEAHDLPLHPGP